MVQVKRKTKIHFSCWNPILRATAVVAVWLMSLRCGTMYAADVRVNLRSENVLDGDLIRVGDVADVESDNAFYAKKVRDLDLLQVNTDQRSESLQIERKLVETRVAFADLGDATVTVHGKSVALVRFAVAQDVDQQFVDAISQALADQLRADVTDIQIELVDSIDLKAYVSSGAESPELVPRVPQPPRLGRLRIPVEMRRGSTRIRALNVSVDAKWNANCVVAKRELSTGDVLTPDDVDMQRRWIDRIDHHAEMTQMIEAKVKRPFRSGDVIRPDDVHRTITEAPYLVNPRDVVRIVAQRGPLRVIVVDGEVMQRGRKGDMVRVRNPNSKAVITARVVDHNEVLIPLY